MLTIDIGNTRIKWGVWEDDEIIRSDEFIHDSSFSEQLFDHRMPDITTIKKIIVANVAGRQAEIELKKWLSDKSNAEPVFLKTQKQCCGVTNAYAKPEQHGVDRWAALIAARSMCDSGVCVIDIGTAVTIDLMNAEGLHRGGMIMPGLNMMRNALLDDTAGITFDEADDESFSQVFAANTEAAVKNGTLHLLRSGLEDVCLQAVNLYGEDIKIIITGGLAEKMLPLLSLSNLMYEPHLVLKGLHIAAQD